MKKQIRKCLAASILLSILFGSITTAQAISDVSDNTDSTSSSVFADLNDDKVVTVSDVTLIQNFIADLVTLGNQKQSEADINYDGTINIVDATIIQRIVAELVDPDVLASGLVYEEKSDSFCLNPYCHGFILGPSFTYTKKERVYGENIYYTFSEDPTDEEMEQAAQEHIAWHKSRGEVCVTEIIDGRFLIGERRTKTDDGSILVRDIYENHKFLLCKNINCWAKSDPEHAAEFHYFQRAIYGGWCNYTTVGYWTVAATGEAISEGDERLHDINNVYAYNSSHKDQLELRELYTGYCNCCKKELAKSMVTVAPVRSGHPDYNEMRELVEQHIEEHLKNGDDAKNRGHVFRRRFVYRIKPTAN